MIIIYYDQLIIIIIVVIIIVSHCIYVRAVRLYVIIMIYHVDFSYVKRPLNITRNSRDIILLFNVYYMYTKRRIFSLIEKHDWYIVLLYLAKSYNKLINMNADATCVRHIVLPYYYC